MPTKTISILSIDDEETYQRVVARFFGAEQGYTLHTAFSGTEGLQKAASIKPDLILLDLSLPDMSGHKVLGILAENETTAHIPVCLVSGSELRLEDAARRASKNLRHIALKPFKFKDLLDRIAVLVNAQPPRCEPETV